MGDRKCDQYYVNHNGFALRNNNVPTVQIDLFPSPLAASIRRVSDRH